jgi:CRP-like cAMP-binding protein
MGQRRPSTAVLPARGAQQPHASVQPKGSAQRQPSPPRTLVIHHSSPSRHASFLDTLDSIELDDYAEFATAERDAPSPPHGLARALGAQPAAAEARARRLEPFVHLTAAAEAPSPIRIRHCESWSVRELLGVDEALDGGAAEPDDAGGAEGAPRAPHAKHVRSSLASLAITVPSSPLESEGARRRPTSASPSSRLGTHPRTPSPMRSPAQRAAELIEASLPPTPGSPQSADGRAAHDDHDSDHDGTSVVGQLDEDAHARLEALAISLEATELFAGVARHKLRRLVAHSSVRTLPRYQVIYRAGARAHGQALYVWLVALGGGGSVLLDGAPTAEEQRMAAAQAQAHEAAASRGASGAAAAAAEQAPQSAIVFGYEGCTRGAELRVRAESATVDGGSVSVLVVRAHDLPAEVVARATALANARLLARAESAQHSTLFASVPESNRAELSKLLRAAELVRLRPDQLVAREGDETGRLYTIVEGSVRSWTELRASAQRTAGKAAGSGQGGGASSADGGKRRAPARVAQSPSIQLGASTRAGLHFGLEALAAFLQAGEARRGRLGACYAAGPEGALLLVLQPHDLPRLADALPAEGLADKVDQLLSALGSTRARAQQAEAMSREMDAMRAQCRESSWSTYGASIESRMDLMRVFGKPVLPGTSSAAS